MRDPLADVPTILTLANPADAFCFYPRQEVMRRFTFPWWRRVARWVKRVVLRRKPVPVAVLVVKEIDVKNGTITLEPR